MGSDCRDPHYCTSAAHQTLPVHYSSVRRIWKGVFPKKKPDSTAEERKEHSTHEDLSSNVAASAGLW